MRVLVATNPELGWDCVVGVWADTKENRAYLEKHVEEDNWVVSDYTVEQNYEDEV